MSNLSDFHGDSNDPAIIFVAEVIKLEELIDPVNIGEQARLVRATGDMRNVLCAILEPHTRTLHSGMTINPWQSQKIPTENGTEIRPVFDPAKHQYWVIQHWRRLFDRQLENALELADPGLTPLISQVHPTLQSSGYVNAHAILNWLENSFVATTQTVAQKEIDGIAQVWKKLVEIEDEANPDFDFIKKAIDDFFELKFVSTRRPLYVLGLFSIIEGLLTTPQDDTTGNSLTHQIKEKLTLFGNRFPKPIDFKVHLPGTKQLDFKKVVSRLYQYRSTVAHGSPIDFETGELKDLQRHDFVCAFLRVLVRRLIVQAINEPALFRDIKRC